MTPGLTFDVEGDLGAPFLLTSAVLGGHALKVSSVLYSVYGSELQVPVLQKASLRVGDGLTVMHPRVHHTLGIARLTAQHGTATVKSVLRLGLFGEVERGRLHVRHWKTNEDEELDTL